MSPSRVLVVEDNPLNRRLAVDVLRSAGYEVAEAEGVLEARLCLARSLPDLIVLDISLPGTDGIALLRQLRADQRTRAIPIVATTALAMERDRERILQAGFDAYLAKPFSPRVFRQVVGALLQGRANPTEAPRG
ncbi:MAG: response regulator [candidate division NC10 bacterium]|nr:response regulator [candidate division NC10 bacterium]MBI3081047.1 response regulator [candidate division NC10 bacterium]MBI4413557.1 response regulator [candidate division NC10 bacterium]